jgi:hypothetical protein
MKNNKFFGKKSALYALVAATAALSMASVSTTAQASNVAVSMLVRLTVKNNTNGCVRVYTQSQHYDIPAHRSTMILTASSRGYMASVYKYGCGGRALGNRWHTTSIGGSETWNIY